MRTLKYAYDDAPSVLLLVRNREWITILDEVDSIVKGFVLTPDQIVDTMVAKLFSGRPPTRSSVLLDPGCGTGAFIEGVIRWCQANRAPYPQIVGVDSDPRHVAVARRRFRGKKTVSIRKRDFLSPNAERYDYIVGNPPYVPITGLTEEERAQYRRDYVTARGRFDLYILFFEQALRVLKAGGRLVFITPEKFLYVETAAPLRRLLGETQVEQIHLVDEATFEGLVTYPAITTASNAAPTTPTEVILRHGQSKAVELTRDGSSWLPRIVSGDHAKPDLQLSDICLRVSCGVATGADSVFLVPSTGLDPQLQSFAHPTIAGRELGPGRVWKSRYSLLTPYDETGTLLPEERLGALGKYLSTAERRKRLLARTCVRRKPWYAFHETPPLSELLRPKILCKDVTEQPYFTLDEAGATVPRHSVYYVIPNNPSHVGPLTEYLNSEPAQDWLRAHCQRAANGFLRIQSHVLKRLPLPGWFANGRETHKNGGGS